MGEKIKEREREREREREIEREREQNIYLSESEVSDPEVSSQSEPNGDSCSL